MSQFNLIREWRCPFCNESQMDLQFMYGSWSTTAYDVGDKIKWEANEADRPSLGERLTDGTGVIETVGLCRNSWFDRWQQKTPGWISSPIPTLEERKRLGCPRQVVVKIELQWDEIKRIFSDEDSRMRGHEDW